MTAPATTSPVIHLGAERTTQNPLALPAHFFTKHAAVLGMTGSGKTGLLLLLVEQYVKHGIPVILVDIKGDMCNIALQDDEDMRSRMNLLVLTPGATHGERINLFANLQRPERVQSSVTQLLKMIGERNTDPLSSKAHAFLSHLLNHYHHNNQPTDIITLINGLQEPPFETLGALTLEEAMPSRSRAALAAKLNTLLVAPSFENWRGGSELDVDKLLHRRKDGMTNVTVYQVSNLDENEREFALALLFDSVVAWMRRQRGVDQLRASLIVDECAGLLPPYPKNPATKPPLMVMLRQARAYGLGLVLSSQNPMDLDYKALSNCETWMVGRLQMDHDRKRVIEAIAASTPHDRGRLNARIGRLLPREFVLCRPRSTADFTSADVSAKLVGPMAPLEIKSMMEVLHSTVRQDIEKFLKENLPKKK